MNSNPEFHGTLLRRRTQKGLSLFEIAYPAGLKLAPHSHDPAGLCLVLEGTFAEQVDRVTHRRGRGMAVFHPPGQSHSNSFDTSAVRMFAVALDSDWLRHRSDSMRPPGCSIELTGRASITAMGLYREFRRSDTASRLAVEGLCIQLLAEVGRLQETTRRRGSPGWFKKALERVHDNFTDHLSLDGISQEVGVHPVHLARTFRARLGCTLGEYIRQLRLQWAREQLLRTRTPLVEIAMHAGFASQSHFCNAFRAAHRMSPSECRALFRRR